MKGKMRDFASSVEPKNQVPCSLQEKNKDMILLDSAPEKDKKYVRKQGSLYFNKQLDTEWSHGKKTKTKNQKTIRSKF